MKNNELSTFKMLKKLWKIVPSDCKIILIEEFIINPRALKERYYNEIDFQLRLKNSWNDDI